MSWGGRNRLGILPMDRPTCQFHLDVSHLKNLVLFVCLFVCWFCLFIYFLLLPLSVITSLLAVPFVAAYGDACVALCSIPIGMDRIRNSSVNTNPYIYSSPRCPPKVPPRRLSMRNLSRLVSLVEVLWGVELSAFWNKNEPTLKK